MPGTKKIQVVSVKSAVSTDTALIFESGYGSEFSNPYSLPS